MGDMETSKRLSGPQRIVWEIVANIPVRIGQSNGFGEVETVGWCREDHTFHVIAERETLALSLWDKLPFGNYPAPAQLKSIKPLCYIDREIKIC